MNDRDKKTHWCLLLFLFSLSSIALSGPFDSFKDILKNKKEELTNKVKEAALKKSAKLAFPLEQDSAIARPSSPGLDHFEPTVWEPMTVLPRTKNGVFKLRPGAFEFVAESYCLKPGTYAKPGGEGYMSGPIKGKLALTFTQILKNTFRHNEISREDVQYLLWGIIAGTPIEKMNNHMQDISRQLLSSQELKKLSKNQFLPDEITHEAFSRLPPLTQKVVQTYREMKTLAAQPNTSFKDLEQVAILPGEPPIRVNGDDPIPKGRWTYHPGGYYIRYFSSDYWKTKIQIVVPNKFKIIRDKYHRIKSMIFNDGGKTEIEYDDSQQPILLKHIADRAVYPIRSLLFSGKNKKTHQMMLKIYHNKGYILAPYSRRHHPQKARKLKQISFNSMDGYLSDAVFYPDANNYNLMHTNLISDFNRAQEIYDQYNSINDDVNYLHDRYRNATRRATDDDLNNIVDIQHYIDAAESVITDPASAPEVVIDQLEAEYLAVARATQIIEDLDKDPSQAGRYDPTREAGLPGLLGYAQRRGMSGRPAF